MGELAGEGREGALGGRAGCRREARCLLLCPCCSCPLAVREKKAGGRRREEKREKRKEEGKEK
jgi:hypothetical protein